MTDLEIFDVVVLGAGASGLMCASEAAKRGRRVLVLDHAKKPGLKIRISGGGRSNFTNLDIQPKCYLSGNPHFCKSALSRFTQWDFLERIVQAGIQYEERSHGQLFCTGTANEIVEMLMADCRRHGVVFRLGTEIGGVEKRGERLYAVETSAGAFQAASLVVATGGLSYASIGASGIGYDIARQMEIAVQEPTPGLVPFTLRGQDSRDLPALAGIALAATASIGETHFAENVLFTHRGLSGPVILQISSYWSAGQAVLLDLLPGVDLFAHLKTQRTRQPLKMVRTVLVDHLPKRLIEVFLEVDLADKKLADCSDRHLQQVADRFQKWAFVPGGTEGYKKAEVTCGGVDCDAVSSKTMEAKAAPGLFFIGEVLDVTGWLGGYNLQWAWSSGWCAGQYV